MRSLLARNSGLVVASLASLAVVAPPQAAANPMGDCRARALHRFWNKRMGLPVDDIIDVPPAQPAHPMQPAPAPVPAPATTTAAPKVSGPQKYCPDPAEDFQEEIEGPPGSADWSDSGWTIHGQRRVSSKTSFDLRGGYVEFDMDLSNAHGGVNTNLYITFPAQPNCGIDCYCDSGATGGCAEIDFTENNGNCFQASTWHDEPHGGNKGGFGGNGGISPHIHVRAEWNPDGSSMTTTVNGNAHNGPGLGAEMDAHGAVIYSSQWTGWVPGNCPGDGNLQASSFTVKNLKIHGAVKQGPQPRLCDATAGVGNLMFKYALGNGPVHV
jgi:hypothetical protein